jgi:cell division protein FtsX
MRGYLSEQINQGASLQIATIAVCLVLPGLLLVGGTESWHIWKINSQRIEPVVFVNENATSEQIEQLRGKLQSVSHVESTKMQSRAHMRDRLEGVLELSGASVAVEDSMFPRTIRVSLSLPYLKYPDFFDNIERTARENTATFSVSSPPETLIELLYAGRFAAVAGLIATGLIAWAMIVFLKASLLTQFQRDKERYILMDRFGLPRHEYRSLLLREGLKVGLLAGALSSVTTVLLWGAAISAYTGSLTLPGLSLGWLGAAAPCLIGAAIGWVGAMRAEAEFVQRGERLSEINLKTLTVGQSTGANDG